MWESAEVESKEVLPASIFTRRTVIGKKSGLKKANSVSKPYELFRAHEKNRNEDATCASALFILGQPVTARKQAWTKRMSSPK